MYLFEKVRLGSCVSFLCLTSRMIICIIILKTSRESNSKMCPKHVGCHFLNLIWKQFGLQNCLMMLHLKRGKQGLLFLTFNIAVVHFTYGARSIKSFGFNSISFIHLSTYYIVCRLPG